MSAPLSSPNSREPASGQPPASAAPTKAVQRVIRQANGQLRLVSAPVGIAANGNILLNPNRAGIPPQRVIFGTGVPLQTRGVAGQPMGTTQKGLISRVFTNPRVLKVLILIRNVAFLFVAIALLNMIAANAGPLPTVVAAFVMYKGGMFIFIESAVLGLKGALNSDEAAYELALRRADSMRAPVTRKEGSMSQRGANISYGFSCMQGWRRSMEDAHTMILDGVRGDSSPLEVPAIAGGRIPTAPSLGPINTQGPANGKGGFFAVFDGHCGQRVANYCSEHLYHFVTKSPAWADKNYRQALVDGFVNMDQHIYQQNPDERSGCTAVAVLISEDGKKLYCANAGDSRAILGQSSAAGSSAVEPLSDDHKPYNRGEQLRIQKAGSVVFNKRVNGILALSRAIGDFNFKKNRVLPWVEQAVTCSPDVKEIDIDQARDDFIVLACDGIWDVRSNDDVAAFVRQRLQRKVPLHTICEQLMQSCLSPRPFGNGCDNMSVIVVTLDDSHFMKSIGGPSTGIASPVVRAAGGSPILKGSPLNRNIGQTELPKADIALDFVSEASTDTKNLSGSKKVAPPPLFLESGTNEQSQPKSSNIETTPPKANTKTSSPTEHLQVASPSSVRDLGFGFPSIPTSSSTDEESTTANKESQSDRQGSSHGESTYTSRTATSIQSAENDDAIEPTEEEDEGLLAAAARVMEEEAEEEARHKREVAEALSHAELFSPKTPPSLHFEAEEEEREALDLDGGIDGALAE